jgi:hypothetical protein
MSPDPNGRKLGKLAAMKPAVLSEDWRIPVLFSLIPVGSVVYAAAHAWFWQRAHDTVWAAAPLLLVLTALLLRRSRLVWWFWVIASGAGVVTWVVDMSTHTVTTDWQSVVSSGSWSSGCSCRRRCGGLSGSAADLRRVQASDTGTRVSDTA